MKKIFFLIFTLFFSINSYASWIEVGQTQSATFYIDPATIKKDKNFVKVWTMRDLNEVAKSPGSDISYLSSRTYEEYDCKEKKYRQLSFYWYSDKQGKGEIVLTNSTASQAIHLPPGSITYGIMKILCEK
jgi:hypothetical protein